MVSLGHKRERSGGDRGVGDTYMVLWCNYCDRTFGVLDEGNKSKALDIAGKDLERHCVLVHPESDEAQAALLLATR